MGGRGHTQRRRLLHFFDRHPRWTYEQLEEYLLSHDVTEEWVEHMWELDRLTVEEYEACLDILSPVA